MIELRAKLLTEGGRPKKLQIPPQSTRVCPITAESAFYLQDMRFEVYIVRGLAIRSLLLVRTGPIENYANFEPLVYNGGWETQWIEHGEAIANIYEFRT